MPFTYRMIGNQDSVTYTFGSYYTLASSSPDSKPFNFSLTANTSSLLHDEFNTADANHSASHLSTGAQFCILEMKVISIPTLTLSRTANVTGDVTATIECGIGPYDTGNMQNWANSYWNKVSTPGGYNTGRFVLAQVDQDNNQTNLVSVGDTMQVICDPRSVLPGLIIGSGGGRGHQGFKSKCTFLPFTQVTGDFVIQITRLS